MMTQRDLSVKQVLAEMSKHYKALDELQEMLITRAQLQEYTEEQFNALAMLAKEGVELVGRFREGDVIDAEWIATRDSLVGRAQRLIQDAPGI
jgi:hypothetical protein